MIQTQAIGSGSRADLHKRSASHAMSHADGRVSLSMAAGGSLVRIEGPRFTSVIVTGLLRIRSGLGALPGMAVHDGGQPTERPTADTAGNSLCCEGWWSWNQAGGPGGVR